MSGSFLISLIIVASSEVIHGDARLDVGVNREAIHILAEAFDYMSDWENLHRDKAVELFLRYLEEDPESVLAPEIYHMIMNLYCFQFNKANGDDYDMESAYYYSQKSADAFGFKFHPLNIGVRQSLAEISGLDEKISFYEWLLSFNGDTNVEDIYPYRGMREVAAGWPARLPESRLIEKAKNIPENQTYQTLVIAASEALIYNASDAELAVLIEKFPETKLAENAIRRLQATQKRKIVQSSNETIEAIELSEKYESASDVESLAHITNVAIEEQISTTEVEAEEPPDSKLLIVLIAVVVPSLLLWIWKYGTQSKN